MTTSYDQYRTNVYAVLDLPINNHVVDIIAEKTAKVIQCASPLPHQQQQQSSLYQSQFSIYPTPPITPSGSPIKSTASIDVWTNATSTSASTSLSTSTSVSTSTATATSISTATSLFNSSNKLSCRSRCQSKDSRLNYQNNFNHGMQHSSSTLFAPYSSQYSASYVLCRCGVVVPSLPRFISRLIRESQVSIGVLMTATVYLDRLRRHSLPKTARGMECTNHRIFLAAMVVASKYFNDVTAKNKYWARHAGGVFSTIEVNLMEKQLLALLGYNLRIEQEEFEECLEQFVHLVVGVPGRMCMRLSAATVIPSNQFIRDTVSSAPAPATTANPAATVTATTTPAKMTIATVI